MYVLSVCHLHSRCVFQRHLVFNCVNSRAEGKKIINVCMYVGMDRCMCFFKGESGVCFGASIDKLITILLAF